LYVLNGKIIGSKAL